MKKNPPIKKNIAYKQATILNKAEEPEAIYRKTVKVIPSIHDFTFADFKKIADKIPFTLAQWAAMLHLSERTLQRYAKNNSSFAPIHAERALQISSLIDEGKKTFGKVSMFYNWLQDEPSMLEGSLSFDSLTTAHGIHLVLTQLGRIQHGILA